VLGFPFVLRPSENTIRQPSIIDITTCRCQGVLTFVRLPCQREHRPEKIPDVCQVTLDACNAQGTTTTAIDEARRKARTEDKNEARHVKRKAMTEERKPFKE